MTVGEPDARPQPASAHHTAVRPRQVPDKVVDARGSYCPGPLMELIKTLKGQPVGAVVELWSSDRGSSKDVPEWVRKAGHVLVYLVEEAGYWRIGVRKAH